MQFISDLASETQPWDGDARGDFDSPGEAHFCSSNSEHAPLDDNKLIRIKQVEVSDCSKEGPCKA